MPLDLGARCGAVGRRSDSASPYRATLKQGKAREVGATSVALPGTGLTPARAPHAAWRVRRRLASQRGNPRTGPDPPQVHSVRSRDTALPAAAPYARPWCARGPREGTGRRISRTGCRALVPPGASCTPRTGPSRQRVPVARLPGHALPRDTPRTWRGHRPAHPARTLCTGQRRVAPRRARAQARLTGKSCPAAT